MFVGFFAIALAGFRRRTRLLWLMMSLYLVATLFQRDWGFDTFDPMHAFELSLPVLTLTIAGAQNLQARLARGEYAGLGWSPSQRLAFSPALLGSLMLTAWSGFVPVRLEAVRQIASHVNRALEAPAAAGLHNVVIFTSWPFTPECKGVPRHFVNFRPVNDPDLHNDILWVNHLDLETDRRFLRTSPGRTGYVLTWNPGCSVRLVPLAMANPNDIPPGRIWQ